jgi:hypothetical protein
MLHHCRIPQVFALQRQLADANASSAEIAASSAALMDLVGEGPALQAMLNCYSHKIRLDQSLLLKQHTAGEPHLRWQWLFEGRRGQVAWWVACGLW